MDHNKKTLKKYQTMKINLQIKTNTILFFFLSSKSKSIHWRENEQVLKNLKLTYYKTINKIALKKFKESIYKNFTVLISGLILLITTNSKRLEKFERIKNLLQKSFSLISLKLNNKMYSINEINQIPYFSYRKNLFVFYKYLERHTKINYIFFYNKNSK